MEIVQEHVKCTISIMPTAYHNTFMLRAPVDGVQL